MGEKGTLFCSQRGGIKYLCSLHGKLCNARHLCTGDGKLTVIHRIKLQGMRGEYGLPHRHRDGNQRRYGQRKPHRTLSDLPTAPPHLVTELPDNLHLAIDCVKRLSSLDNFSLTSIGIGDHYLGFI